MKKKILFYTDCPIFGGCEKPIFEVISSGSLDPEYDFVVIFRNSKEYLEGLSLFWPDFPKDKFLSINLFDSTSARYLTKKIKNPLLSKITGKFVTFIFMLTKPLVFMHDLITLSILFSRQKADIIHINNGGYPGALSCRAAAVAARHIGCKKVIFSVHNTAFDSNGIIESMIDNFVRRSVDIIITGSRASGSALVKKRGFDKNKIITIYHGVRETDIIPGKASQEKSIGSEKYILMVARFEARKGHEYAIRAFKKVIDENKAFADLKLVLIGDGPALDDTKRLIAYEQLDNNVRFMGHRADYLNYVASSLFLLNPSIGYEDLPYIILEAMSLGVPVIGTDIAGIPEEIENGVTGIIVPPKDTEALGQAILKMLSDGESRRKMGVAAKERFRLLFMLDKMRINYRTLYGKSI